MTDQKLVDELEKALRDEAYDGGFGYMGDEQFPAYVRTLAETAAEVVEKALTPTDDEREAPESTSDVARIIDRAMRPWGLSNIGTHSAARALISAGYRRFEAQQ